VAARFADRFDWGYIPTLELYEHKLKILGSHCEKIGRVFQKIEKSCWPWGQIFIESNPQNVEKTVQRAKPKGVPLEDFKKNNFVGSAEACQEKIQKYKNIGVTHFMLFFGDLPNLNGLRLFAKRTMKRE
jgi:alkanesulfonate monooxygenase SsuD/methylene tetrahydromethanopterin reductase-like flavin-dependent oxidoreductase (luciferase family)